MTNLLTPKEVENTVALKKLRVKILTTFRTLVDPEFLAPLGKPQYKSLVYRFGDLLTLPNPDTGRLPYWTGTNRAVRSKKVDCVLAIVSWVVTSYWHLVADPEDYCGDHVIHGDFPIEKQLDQLQYIVEHWGKLKVAGSIRERYYLTGIPELEEPEDEQEERNEIRAEKTETETD